MPAKTSVLVTTGGGSATPGSDYTAVAKRVVFGAGATTGFITIAVRPDIVNEAPGETIGLTLSNPLGGLALGRAAGTVTIADDDN